MDIEKLKYPIGKHEPPVNYSSRVREELIQILENFPSKIRAAIFDLNNEKLDTPYRPEGWTIRQVVHHCADSHMNSLIRFKLALTEDTPIIKPYLEEKWAVLGDSKNFPIEPSLTILEGVHVRLTALLRSLSWEQLNRTFIHPEHGNAVSLNENMSIYAWHCRHHLAHITTLKNRMGW